MSILLEIPHELEERLREEIPNLDAEAKVAFALDLFRKEIITVYELRLLLSLSRSEVNQLLVSRKEWAQSLTMEDLENDYPRITKTIVDRDR